MTIRQYLLNNLWYGENSREANRAKHWEGADLTAITSLVMPDPSRPWGIDLSHWNLPPVDLRRMKEVYGLRFVIAKACDGSLNSRYYPEHVAAAKAAGLPWGAYNWLYPGAKVSIDAQVNAWWARYRADVPPMGIFIDAEWTSYGGQSAHPGSADLRSAHDKWYGKSLRRATTYTAPGYADVYLRGFDWSREPLWIANYGVSRPTLPAGANGYSIWQFTSNLDGSQLDPAGNAELDGNYWFGEFPEGGTMQFRANQDAKLWRSQTAGVFSGEIGLIRTGETVTGSNIGNGVLQLTNPIGYTKAQWFTVVSEPPPPPPPPTGPTRTHTIEVYSDGSVKIDGNAVP